MDGLLFKEDLTVIQRFDGLFHKEGGMVCYTKKIGQTAIE